MAVPLLVVLHHGDKRLLAALDALAAAGFAATGVASEELARDALAASGPAAALLLPFGAAGVAFGRACLVGRPRLTVLYLTRLPWRDAVPPLGPRECLLRRPFTAAALAAALAAGNRD